MAEKASSKRISQVFAEPWKKHRTFRTVSLFVTFCSLGLSASVLGPTIVSMEVLLDTNTEKISATFTGGPLGYLIGAVFCGVIYSRLNKELLFACSLIGNGSCLALAPFSPNLIFFIAANGLQSFFMGITDTAGQSYLLSLWRDHKYRRPLMQSLHGLWSVGATVGPFIVEHFLVDLPQEENDATDSNVTMSAIDVFNASDNVNESLYSSEPTHTNVELVRLAYVVIAAMVIASSVFFIVIFFLLGPSCLDPYPEKSRESDSADDAVKTTKRYRRFYVRFLVVLAFLYFFILWVEGIPGNLMAVFVVKGLRWANEQGARITAVYWGCHGLARVCGIPLAAVMSPMSMLIMDMTIVAAGFGLFLFVNVHVVVPWVAVSMAGLGIGSIFPSGILWADGFIEISGAASSVLLTASSVGGMTGPTITGFLMGHFTYMCFVYVLIVALALMVGVYTAAILYVRKEGFLPKRRTSLINVRPSATEQETMIENSSKSTEKSSQAHETKNETEHLDS